MLSMIAQDLQFCICCELGVIPLCSRQPQWTASTSACETSCKNLAVLSNRNLQETQCNLKFRNKVIISFQCSLQELSQWLLTLFKYVWSSFHFARKHNFPSSCSSVFRQQPLRFYFSSLTPLSLLIARIRSSCPGTNLLPLRFVFLFSMLSTLQNIRCFAGGNSGWCCESQVSFLWLEHEFGALNTTQLHASYDFYWCSSLDSSSVRCHEPRLRKGDASFPSVSCLRHTVSLWVWHLYV